MEYIFNDTRNTWQKLKDKALNINFSKPSANKAFLATFIIILAAVPLTVFVAMKQQSIRQQAATDQKSDQRLEKPIPPKGYIIEFKTQSLSFDVGSLGSEDMTSVKNAFNLRKAQILSEHELAKQDILSKLEKTSFDFSKYAPGDKKVKIIGEFTNAFNGIALDIDGSEVNKIKDSPFVKAVYPNNSVKVDLNESVPLIGADKVWSLKDAKGVNIRGKDINIAILDTGIDYTHKDLGNTKIEERKLNKISTSSFTTYPDLDQIISYNKDRVAYASGDDAVSIYSFATSQTERLNLGTTGIFGAKIHNLKLSDDRLFYISQGTDAVNLYMKNIKNKRLTKISDMGILEDRYATAGRYDVSNGKLIYERQTGTRDIYGNRLYNIYSYDIAAANEVKLLKDSICLRFPKVNGNNFAYTEEDNGYCQRKLTLYNIATNKKTEINIDPLDASLVIDFKGDLILNLACCSDGIYSLYNLKTGKSKKLRYISPISPDSSSQEAEADWTSVSFYVSQTGLIGDGVVFFKKNSTSNKIIAYDLDKERYVEINLKTPAGSIDGVGKKICFASASDYQIYCHDYDGNYGYPLPARLYNQKVIGGYNFVNSTTDAIDDNGHGTHVAGIAAGNGRLKGVAPDANLISYKVIDSYGLGYFSTVISAIDKAIQTRFDDDSLNDIDVINLSLGANCGRSTSEYSNACGPQDPLSRAVNKAFDNGIVVGAAAGNGGEFGDLISSPGTAANSITVGAIDKSKKIADFSSKGPVIWEGVDLKKPDVVGPGVDICSARFFAVISLDLRCLDDDHIRLSGTSMATPHAAGLAALVMQAYPNWSPEQIKQAIKNSAQNIGYNYNTQGSGMIDAVKLFAEYIIPTPTASPYKKVTLTAVKDTYVREDKPQTNFGATTVLRSDDNPRQISYLGFDLSFLRDKKIISAKLVLKVGQVNSSLESETFNLKQVTKLDWLEEKVTYSNRPKLASGNLTTFRGKKTGETIEIDVKNIVEKYKGEIESVAITTNSKNTLVIRSREAAEGKQKLIVEYE